MSVVSLVEPVLSSSMICFLRSFLCRVFVGWKVFEFGYPKLLFFFLVRERRYTFFELFVFQCDPGRWSCWDIVVLFLGGPIGLLSSHLPLKVALVVPSPAALVR